MGPTRNLEYRADWLTLYRMLERMSPSQRIAWGHGCCQLVRRGGQNVRMEDARGELDEMWYVYLSLTGQGALNVDSAGRLAGRILNQ